MCDEVIYPGELPVEPLYCVAPVHFRPPIGGPVFSLHVLAPLPVRCGPLAKGPSIVDEIYLSSVPGLSTLHSWGPHSLLAAIYGPVSSSLHVHAGLRAAALGDEAGLSSELVSAQHAVIPPDPCHAVRGSHLSLHIQIASCQVPPCHVVHAGSRNEVIAGHGAACWPGTHPLQLLTVYLEGR